MTRLSLCLIARDEAHFLPACLESVKDVVDEIIVVDTGSVDDTSRIAQNYGARVVFHEWQDDFSKARNAALPFATGDWILILDADEQLAPGSGLILRQAIEKGNFDFGLLPLYDALTLEAQPSQIQQMPHLFKPPVFLHRLFIHDAGLTWKNKIHESVTWLESPGRRGLRVNAAIAHYGNIPEIRKKFSKNQRNFRLIKKMHFENPDDLIFSVIFLSERYRESKDEDVFYFAETCFKLLQRNFETVSPIRHPRFVNAVVIYMWFLSQANRFNDALEVMRLAEGWKLSHPNLTWMGACCYENLALQRSGDEKFAYFEKAQACYQNLLEQDNHVFASEVSPGITNWHAHLSLGRICLSQDKNQLAKSHFEQAKCRMPENDPSIVVQREQVELGIIECDLNRGDFRAVLRGIRKTSSKQCEDFNVLKADCYERSGNFSGCVQELKKILSSDKDIEFRSSSCQRRFKELMVLINLYRGTPIHGEGAFGTISQVILGEPVAQLIDHYDLDKGRLKRVLLYLRKEKGIEYFIRFFEDDVQSAIPVICEAVREALSD